MGQLTGTPVVSTKLDALKYFYSALECARSIFEQNRDKLFQLIVSIFLPAPPVGYGIVPPVAKPEQPLFISLQKGVPTP